MSTDAEGLLVSLHEASRRIEALTAERDEALDERDAAREWRDELALKELTDELSAARAEAAQYQDGWLAKNAETIELRGERDAARAEAEAMRGSTMAFARAVLPKCDVCHEPATTRARHATNPKHWDTHRCDTHRIEESRDIVGGPQFRALRVAPACKRCNGTGLEPDGTTMFVPGIGIRPVSCGACHGTGRKPGEEREKHDAE